MKLKSSFFGRTEAGLSSAGTSMVKQGLSCGWGKAVGRGLVCDNQMDCDERVATNSAAQLV